MNILAFTYTELLDDLALRYGKSAYHAAALYREVLRKGNLFIDEAPEFEKSPELAANLRDDLHIPATILEAHQDAEVTRFTTTFSDGDTIESVIIPEKGRTTLCVSSQVGCRMGCTFCATGAGGFVRNLAVEEIVGQVFSARFTMGREVDNIVFMGMGEPLDNIDNVLQSVRVLSDQRGLSIPRSHITVSTVGPANGLARLAASDLSRIHLAVSINAPTDDLRSSLMPVNRRVSLAALKAQLLAFPHTARDVFLVGYVLLADVNDSHAHAKQLARYLHELPVRVNLIPYNECTSLAYRSPTPERVARFRAWLVQEGLFVRIRQPHGQGVSAACGQLRGSRRTGGSLLGGK
jgi:23S rRNA (adenine2503-C2)-methyltransferase